MTEQERKERKNGPLTIGTGQFLHGILTTPDSLEELRRRLKAWFVAYLHHTDGMVKTGPFPNEIDLYDGLDDFLLHLDKQLNRS